VAFVSCAEEAAWLVPGGLLVSPVAVHVWRLGCAVCAHSVATIQWYLAWYGPRSDVLTRTMPPRLYALCRDRRERLERIDETLRRHNPGDQSVYFEAWEFYRKFIQIASGTGHHAAIRLPQTLDGPQREESGIAAAL